ncbi:MAG: LLM class flavin-dependent oxidoreductase [Acidimicrobiales bacterium]
MTVEFWRMGATPVPLSHVAQRAQAFEADGWDGLAIGEAHGVLPDPYAVLAACAAATTTLKLGTAVSVPLRSALLAADAMATLQTLTDGRARFCLGRGGGGPKIVPRWPITTGEFEIYLQQLQALLGREGADFSGRTVTMSLLDEIDPSLRRPRPLVDVAVTGPRTLEIAARHADGLNFSVGANLEVLSSAARSGRAAWASAGRDPSTLTMGCFVQVAVTAPGDDRARRAIEGLVMTHSHFSIPRETPLTARPLSGARPTEAPDAKDPGEFEFYTHDAGIEERIDTFAIAGEAAHCAQRLGEIVEIGFERIYIGTRSVGIDAEEDNTSRIGRDVLAGLR